MEERRNPVRRLAGALSASTGALVALALAGAAHACELPPGERVESARLAISFWTIPAKIAVGQPFALELAACPKHGVVALERFRFSARMPEHGHGMNYRTKVVRLGTGRFHSEGWLFHMPGRWAFEFDLGSEHLTHSVLVE